MTPREGPSLALPLVALIFGGLAFLALLDSSVVTAGGVFEYPLDDTYIHLAMAEQLAAGGYGVNAGEYAAASSSPLFSVLLLPFAGDAVQRYLPLIWNVVGLVAALILWGRILWQAGWGARWLGFLIAAIAPIALNIPGVAFVGMEHSLHVAASLAILSGLIRFVDEGKIGWLLLVGVLLSPLLRLEGVALAGLAGLVVLFHGRIAAGIALGVLAVAPLAGFAFWLTTLGLEPLPSSVSAKLALPGSSASGFGAFIAGKQAMIVAEPRAWVLCAMLLSALVLLVVGRLHKPILLVVLLAGLAHLLAGRFGWMDRYEIYILATMASGLFATTAGNLRLALLPVATVSLPAWVYLPFVTTLYPHAPRSVAFQQVQMGRFAKEHWQAPVAVNDLGYVAWRNPSYVLDLWGLANHEARQQRLFGDDRLWAAKLAEKHGTEIAMIYEKWFPNQLGDDWQLLGHLKLQVPRAYLADDTVSFFLTHGGDTAPAVERLNAWVVGLPDGAVFEFASAEAGQ